ncbi:MAG: hypothetical protein KC483_10860 [Nitrosarchaeum sp.]|nr:hypothetical protein [Nitrosarchaeum sp.]
MPKDRFKNNIQRSTINRQERDLNLRLGASYWANLKYNCQDNDRKRFIPRDNEKRLAKIEEFLAKKNDPQNRPPWE